MKNAVTTPEIDGPTAWGHFCTWAGQSCEKWEHQVKPASDETTWKAAFEGWQECAVRAIESLNLMHTEPSMAEWNVISTYYRTLFDMPSTTKALGSVFQHDDERLAQLGKDLKKRWFRLSETNIGEYHILDMLAKQKLLGWTDCEEIIVFVNNAKVVNWRYLNMWAEAMPDYLKIIPYEAGEDVPPELVPETHSPLTAKYVLPLPILDEIVGEEGKALAALARNAGWVWKERYHQVLQEHWDKEQRADWKPLPLNKVQAKFPFGIYPDSWGDFVCLHLREGGWKHESDVDRHACRNCDPSDYIPAIEEIVARGLKVVRLGHPDMKALPDISGLIDLSREDHDPVLDVAAMANARFFMGPDSGPSSMASAFGTPSLITDLFPWTRRPQLAGDMYVPRLVHARWAYPGRDGWTPGDRMLTVAEMFKPPWYDMPVSDPFKGFKCRWVPNTPEELAEAAVEMFSKSEQDFLATIGLQEAFDACDGFDEYGFVSRCSPSFLRKHAGDLGLE